MWPGSTHISVVGGNRANFGRFLPEIGRNSPRIGVDKYTGLFRPTLSQMWPDSAKVGRTRPDSALRPDSVGNGPMLAKFGRCRPELEWTRYGMGSAKFGAEVGPDWAKLGRDLVGAVRSSTKAVSAALGAHSLATHSNRQAGSPGEAERMRYLNVAERVLAMRPGKWHPAMPASSQCCLQILASCSWNP